MKRTIALEPYAAHLPVEVREALGDVPDDATLRRKAVEIKQADGDDAPPRTFEATITASSIDRDDEIVWTPGLKVDAFLRNPVVCWGHQWHIPPVGSALSVDVGERSATMRATLADTDFALDLWKLVEGGHLRTVSIGFWPRKTLFKGEEEFDRWLAEHLDEYDAASLSRLRCVFVESNLLEVSLCTIPANLDAQLRECVKQLSPETRERLDIDIDIDEEPPPSKGWRVVCRVADKQFDVNDLAREAIELARGRV